MSQSLDPPKGRLSVPGSLPDNIIPVLEIHELDSMTYLIVPSRPKFA